MSIVINYNIYNIVFVHGDQMFFGLFKWLPWIIDYINIKLQLVELWHNIQCL